MSLKSDGPADDGSERETRGETRQLTQTTEVTDSFTTATDALRSVVKPGYFILFLPTCQTKKTIKISLSYHMVNHKRTVPVSVHRPIKTKKNVPPLIMTRERPATKRYRLRCHIVARL